MLPADIITATHEYFLTGRVINLPRGIFNLYETVDLNQKSLIIRGAGSGIDGTIIKWRGAAGQPMFRARDCARIDWEDFTILGDDVSPPLAAIYLESLAAGTVGTNEHCGVRRINFGRNYTKALGELKGKMDYGVLVGGVSNTNNDSFTIEDCQLYDCSLAGIEIRNPQSIWGNLRNVNFDTCGYGLNTDADIFAYNLTFNRNTITDIRADAASRVQVLGFQSEHAKLLFDVRPGASLFIDGGNAKLNTEVTGLYWGEARISAEAVLDLRNLRVFDQVINRAVHLKLFVSGSTSNVEPAVISIRNCVLPNGDSDEGYAITVFDTPMHFDIKQWGYTYTPAA